MIEGVCGLMGQGKTLFTTAQALRAREMGWPVFANYRIADCTFVPDMTDLLRASLPALDDQNRPILDPETGRPPMKLVIIDEANLTAPSRYWNKLPPKVLYYWSQSRKLGLHILWTAQHEKRVDTALKEVTYRVWHSHHVGRFHWYTASLPDEQHKQKRTGMGRKLLWRSSALAESYDTLQLIDLSAELISLDGPDWRQSAPEHIVVQPANGHKKRGIIRRG